MIVREATEDRRLSAIVRGRIPLLYEHGADEVTDRPAHVRAASGLARVGGEIALIQDDANFVALIDPSSGRARPIPLPVGEGGVRLFDRHRGNKTHKLDLEACVTVEIGGDPVLLAFGSGSTPRRELVVRVRLRRDGADPDVRVVALPAFYATLRRTTTFAGSELNLEGAVVVGARLRLFSRGNGRASGTLSAVNACCDVDLAAFVAHLETPALVAPPEPMDVVVYELGVIAGVRLGFTDAASHSSTILYSAAAESSPDAVEDGAVAGSAIGIIDASENPRWAVVTEPSGNLFAGKVEGILTQPMNRGELLAVIDMDDPLIPSEVCTIELNGPWVP